MDRRSVFRLAAVLTASLGLNGCSLQNDGHMFQRWADAVAAIPVEDPGAPVAATPAAAPVADTRQPLSVQVVDAIDMPSARAAGLRSALHLVEASVQSEGERVGLRPALSALKDTTAKVGAAAPRAVQLAAFSSDAAARQAWGALKSAHPDLVNGVQARFEHADLGARGVWVRLKAYPVASADQARKLCAAIGAKGCAASA